MNSPTSETYVVCYDLMDEDGDYGPPFETLQAVESDARPLESVRIVSSRLPMADLARAWSSRPQPEDRLLRRGVRRLP